MTTKPQTNDTSYKISPGLEVRRRRRHWHPHEKVTIVEAYDKGELLSVSGEPNTVIDPKSKEKIKIFQIEGWKDYLRGLGLIKRKEVISHKPVAAPAILAEQKVLPTNDAMQTLLVATLLENQKLKSEVFQLKTAVEILRKGGGNASKEQDHKKRVNA